MDTALPIIEDATATRRVVLEAVPFNSRPLRARPPVTGTLRHKTPNVWDSRPAVVAVASLTRAGIDVPAEVTDPLDRGTDLRDQAHHLTATNARTDLARQVADGTLTPADAADQAITTSKASTTQRVSEQRQVLMEASEHAYGTAAVALAKVGDTLIEGPLRDTVRDLLAGPVTPDTEQAWADVWGAVAALRTMFATSMPHGVPHGAQLFARPDLVRAWRFAQVAKVHRRAIEVNDEADGYLPDGRPARLLVRTAVAVPGRDTRLPDATTLAVAVEHRDAWGADLHAVAEVIANTHAIHERQNAIAANDAKEPTAASLERTARLR
jgi:hypothetical protein